MDNAVETPAGRTPPAEPPFVEFTGRRGPLFKLVLKNILLNVVTLGIFRFWAKTRVRRYFWSNIVIGGEPLEYTGRGLELLIGFLIVLVVLVPLSLLQSGLDLLLQSGSFILAGAFNVVYLAVFLYLIQFALFRMWRYRLTRTQWRGIRFGLDGSAFRYAGRAFLWMIAQMATLGVVTPWANVDLMRYKVRKVHFGDTQFGLEGRGRDLLKPWLITMGIPLVIGIAGVAGMIVAPVARSSTAIWPLPQFSAWGLLIPLAGFLFWGLWFWYRVQEFRYLVGCVRFGGAEFHSEAQLRKMLPALLLAVALFFVMWLVIGGAMVMVVYATRGGGGLTPAAAFVPFLLIFVFVILSPLVIYPVIMFSIIRHIWTTLSVSDSAAFDAAAQAPERAPKFGEGLADAFDVGAF